MKKKTLSSGNAVGIAMALLVFALGVFLSLVFTFIWVFPFGCFFGPLLCIVALFMGGKRSKVYRCTRCGIVVPRA